MKYDLENGKLQRQEISFPLEEIKIEQVKAANENIANPENPYLQEDK
jgi:hypothetical protein